MPDPIEQLEADLERIDAQIADIRRMRGNVPALQASTDPRTGEQTHSVSASYQLLTAELAEAQQERTRIQSRLDAARKGPSVEQQRFDFDVMKYFADKEGGGSAGPRWKPGEYELELRREERAERGLGLEAERGEETARHNKATEFLSSLARAVDQGRLDEEVAQNKFLNYLRLRQQATEEFGAAVNAWGTFAKSAVPPGMTTYPGTEPGGQISRVTGGPPMSLNSQPVDVNQMLTQALANTPMPAPR